MIRRWERTAYGVAVLAPTVIAVIVARRSLGLPTAVVTGLVATVIVHTLGAHLGDWWNPYPPVVWFFAFAVGVVAALFSGGTPAWVWTVLFGCLAAQAHVSFFILVALTATAAVIGAALTRQARRPRTTAWWIAFPMVLIFWLPVLWDLAFGLHNLTRISGELTQRHQRVGFSNGLRLAARELVPWGPLVRGGQPHDLAGVSGARPLLLLTAGIGLGFLTYLATRHREMLVLRMPAVGISVAAGAAIASASPQSVLPSQRWAPVINKASTQFSERLGHLGRPIILDYVEDQEGLIAPGIIRRMAARYDVRSLDAAKFMKWGHKRAYLPTPPFAGYTILALYPDDPMSRKNACVLRHHGKVVVDATTLTPSEAKQYQLLKVSNYVSRGHLRGSNAKRYQDLQVRAARVEIVAGLYRAVCWFRRLSRA